MDLLLLIIIVGALIGIPYSINQSHAIKEAWAEAANELGLELVEGTLFESKRILGHSGAFGVEVETEKAASGERTQSTRVRVTYPRRLPLHLHLPSEGIEENVWKPLGSEGIEIGEDSFDDPVWVEGEGQSRVKEFLTPARRKAIQRCFESFSDVTINDRLISVLYPGGATDASEIVTAVRQVLDLARSLTSDSPEDGIPEDGIVEEEIGRLETVIEDFSTGVSPVPPLPPAPWIRIEKEPPVEVERGRTEDERAEVETRAAKTAEPDSRIAESPGRSSAEESASRGEAAPETAPRPHAAPARKAGSVDVETVCRTLLAEGQWSFDSTRVFEERFAGRPVQWSGKLLEVASNSFDFVFGNDPGAKATLEVFGLDTNPYGSNHILAIVQLLAGEPAELDSWIGESVSFEGTLKHADGFLKKIYVAEGRLLDARHLTA